jgi:uncharacterized metal-binding protein YceD (DUF177 family)
MTEPELHRPVRVDRLAPHERHEVVATPAECAALAARMAVPAVGALSCVFRLTSAPGGVILAEGTMRARVTQICVVSLEPFKSTVEEDFRIRFVPEGAGINDEDPESDDELPYSGNTIDLGEAAAEQLGLALDPFPRDPRSTLPDSAAEGLEGPFAALRRLKPPQ